MLRIRHVQRQLLHGNTTYAVITQEYLYLLLFIASTGSEANQKYCINRFC